MMTFKMAPTIPQLRELRAQLSNLAKVIAFDPAASTLTVDIFEPKNQRAIEDIVMPYMPIVTDLPDWAALTRAHGKPLRAGAR